MAARYVRIGQYPDYRDEVRGTLLEILASTANPGTYAAPEDVTGCTLEMGADGLWTGASVGTLTQVQADALVASGAMASVKVGTPAQIDGGPVTWGGAGVGWASLSRFAYDPRDILGFGNSHIMTEGGLEAYGNNISFYDSRGIITQATALTDGVAKMIENLAVGGRSSAALLKCLQEAMNSKAGTVVFCEITNDANSGSTFASVKENYAAIFNGILSAGKNLIAFTGIPPEIGGSGANNLQFYTDANAWIMAYNHANYYPCDVYSLLVNGGTGYSKVGMLRPSDHTHLTAYGASTAAPALTAVLAKICPPADIVAAAQAKGTNLVVNPFFGGSSGSPTSWSAIANPTSWNYALAHNHDSRLTAVANVTEAATWFGIQQQISANLPLGKRCRAYIKLYVSGGAMTASNAAVAINGTGYSVVAHTMNHDGANVDFGPLNLSGYITLRTNSFQITNDATRVDLKIQFQGTALYQLLHAYVGEDQE